jgi:alkylation response protein AidB-like acyl-CoA dehydrogenase
MAMTLSGPAAFPADRAEKRRVLLDAVESIRDVLAAHADESEALGTLAPACVEAMSSSGLWRLKLPAELGGAEADPITQMDVIEAVTKIDTSAGWATMIGATSAGWPGAYLPDAGAEIVFKDGRVPTVAGVGGISGTAEVVEGGYKVTGRFPFASGALHAEWLIAGAPVQRVEGEPPELRMFVLPADQATIHRDSWNVAGLKGTGSCDFSTDQLFVPDALTWDRGIMTRGEPERGGAIFHLGMPAFTANEHAGFCLGGATRALELMIELAQAKKRGVSSTLIASRQVYQHFVGESDIKLKAARARADQALEAAYAVASSGKVPDARLQAEVRASSIFAADVSVEVAHQCFRFAGGGALQSSNLLQRYWRDVIASAQHGAVSDAGYEAHGQFLLGMTPEVGMTGPSNVR